MISLEKKERIKKDFQHHVGDTGSASVQIALMTERINELNKHFGLFPKDNASRTGLLKLVGRRRKYLDYLLKSDKARYEDLIARLGLRK